MALATPKMFHGLTWIAERMRPAVPVNSERMSGLLLKRFWQIMYSIEVVFIPSRTEVISARSATESSAKYSSLSII